MMDPVRLLWADFAFPFGKGAALSKEWHGMDFFTAPMGFGAGIFC